MGIRRYFISILVIGFFCFGLSRIASSEPVMIEGVGQSKGQGWLFGSPEDATCWIATPAHIVRSGKSGEVADFIWRDVEGGQGSAMDTFMPENGTDLAFARVVGRAKGDCLSRLGADSLTGSIRRQPDVEAIVMQKTHIEPHAMKVRSFNEEFLTFEPSTDTVRAFMKPGISGAPLILRKDNGLDEPLGLITSVERDQSSGYALRFDLIKSLFLLPSNTEKNKGKALTTNFQIISATGQSIDPNNAVDSILTQERCWRARPNKGERSYSLVVRPDPELGVKQATMTLDANCGKAPQTVIVEYDNVGKWRTFGQCRPSSLEIVCSFPKAVTDNIRFTFIARDGLDRAIQHLHLK